MPKILIVRNRDNCSFWIKDQRNAAKIMILRYGHKLLELTRYKCIQLNVDHRHQGTLHHKKQTLWGPYDFCIELLLWVLYFFNIVFISSSYTQISYKISIHMDFILQDYNMETVCLQQYCSYIGFI